MQSSEVVTTTMSNDAFAEFVREAEPRLRRALCAAFGAQDGRAAAAYALGHAWENWSAISRKSNPIGYLWVVGRNEARRARQRPLPFTRMGAEPEHRDPLVEPGLDRALGRLSERQRTIVLLVHGFDWTLGEVSSLMGVSKSTVQTQLRRGMAKLRHALGVDSGRV